MRRTTGFEGAARAGAALACALFAAAAPAAARSPCDARLLPEGPVPAGFDEADFGVVRGACPRTEVGVGVDGRAIVENENFYGNIRAAGRVDVEVQPFPQLELFASSELLSYQLVIQSFKADNIGLGDTSAGMKLLAFAHDSFALSVLARADLPTAFGYYKNAFPVGLEAGVLALIEPIRDVRLHGGLLGGTKLAITKADPNTRAAVIANAGIDLVVTDWLAFVADLDAQALERGDLDHVSVGAGARFAVADTVGIEAGAVIPLAGSERNLATGILRVSVPF